MCVCVSCSSFRCVSQDFSHFAAGSSACQGEPICLPVSPFLALAPVCLSMLPGLALLLVM